MPRAFVTSVLAVIIATSARANPVYMIQWYIPYVDSARVQVDIRPDTMDVSASYVVEPNLQSGEWVVSGLAAVDSMMGVPRFIAATAERRGSPPIAVPVTATDSTWTCKIDLGQGDRHTLRLQYSQSLHSRRATLAFPEVKPQRREQVGQHAVPSDVMVFVTLPESLATPKFSWPFRLSARGAGTNIFRFHQSSDSVQWTGVHCANGYEGGRAVSIQW